MELKYLWTRKNGIRDKEEGKKMFWYVLMIVCLVLTAGGVIWHIVAEVSSKYIDDGIPVGIATISGIILFLLIIIIPIVKISDNQFIATFKQQKTYIESQDNSTQNIALTTKKIEYNQKLYDAQYEYNKFKIFTLYDKEIMELNEIR